MAFKIFNQFTKQVFKTGFKQPKLLSETFLNIPRVNNRIVTPKILSPNYKIIMVRNGESEWNKKNLFCGWYDASLTLKGHKEAKEAGQTLKKQNYVFDVAHTSVLERAQDTLCLILIELDQLNIPKNTTWRLNESHYGSLTGLNKSEIAAKYGEEQVKKWRRSFDTPPPPMKNDHPYYDDIIKDCRYKNEPTITEFPMSESLKSTLNRTIPYWNQVIVPQLKQRKRIIITAHGNSLRSIIKYLDNISDEAIMNVNLPTGIPFEYVLDKNFKPLVSMNFLGDEETVKKAMEAVAAQGKTK